MSILVNVSRPIINWIIPPSCLLCGASAPRSLCLPCYQELPWLNTRCELCALPLEVPGTCAHCLEKPPSFADCVSPFRFADPVGPLINQFKLRRNQRYGSVLSAALLERVLAHYPEQKLPQAIIPVPLHWRRILRRGFNQATFIGQAVGRQLGIPVRSLLRRPHPTPKQQGLNRKQRLGNLKHAFALKAHLVKGNSAMPNHVALVDDVMTTGATAEAASQVLKHAGVNIIDVWVLARTPSPR